jgi:hypothetical protein
METIDHAILSCQYAQVVWREVKQCFKIRLDQKHFVSSSQWLFDFLERANELQASVAVVTFWHMWEARNETRKLEEKPNPLRTCAKIFAYMELIKENLLKKEPVIRCESRVPSVWTPPPPGVLLLNSDAAIFKDAGRMGACVVFGTIQVLALSWADTGCLGW